MKIGVILFLLVTGTCFCQDIGELSNKFTQSKTKHLKMVYASELAWKWRNINPDSSFRYGKIALNISRKLGDKKTEAYSLSDIGSYYKHIEQYKRSYYYLMESLRIRKRIGISKDIASSHNQLGLLFKQQERFDSAIVHFQKGIQTLTHDQQSMKGSLIDGLGMCFMHIGKFQKALFYVSQSLRIAEHLNDSLSIGQSHQNLGVIYEKQGAPRLALVEFKTAERIYSGLKNQNGIFESIINQATVYQQLGEISKADTHFIRAEDLCHKINFLDYLPTIWFNRAELYLEKDPERSLLLYKLVFQNANSGDKNVLKVSSMLGLMDASIRSKKLDDATYWKAQLEKNTPLSSLSLRKDFMDLCIKYSQMKGDFESAFRYNQDYIRIRDSIDFLTLNNLETLSLLEKAQSKEKISNEKLKRLKVAEKAKENQTRMWLIIMFIVMILLSVSVLTMALIYKMRLEKKRNELNEQQLQQEMTDLVHGSDLRVLEESLNVESKTRKDIGKDLHDNLGSKLAVVQIMLESFRKKTQDSSNETQEKLLTAIQLVDDSCNDLRTISRNLVNIRVNETGLIDSIAALCNNITENTALRVAFQSEKEPLLSNVTSRKDILATISLLIHNILCHSEATEAEVILEGSEEQLSIIVRDNGIGFDQNTLKHAEGIGLQNARERIEAMQGTIKVLSEKGNGTTIFIQLPII
ncbi:tetratricopeptide repeat-containing sensor histidine kinase [Fluviicola taffensis]|uniref:Oxygen sensor histidine kinase NreB n=1 Tax=Fluviicola taffensis (strain DSM 16823 / NCIMB 13979 / RW262) TaxID=755732 RepID=F2IEA3_FLUTR|nr:tetratricopeptide repeat-containing sensor histidine kinase [Fluviicola taffensis]AEA42421.1 histidine kinase [Fluviicola taffensis DSM 16823]